MLIIVNDNKFGKEPIMLTIPSAAEQLFIQFSPAFTQPTFQRILPLAIGAIIALGRRTVTAVLWTMRSVVDRRPLQYVSSCLFPSLLVFVAVG